MNNINVVTTDPNEINEIVNLVCMYYAQLHSKDPRYKSSCATDLELVASFYGKNYGNLKNRKDAFDAKYDNGRMGWHKEGHTLEHRPICYITYEKYKDVSREDLEKIVNDIIRQIKAMSVSFF